MSWYRAGTIQVTNGSTAVVGTSTAFIANVAIGEGLLAPDGKVYEIAAVTSDTGLTLGSAYLGSNASGQTYAIIPSQSYVRDLATQAATLVNSYQTVKDNAGAGKFGDGTVGSPGVQFLSDSDTGIRRTGANAIALVTGGADRVTLDANGTLAVTNSSSANAVTITQTGSGNAFVVEDSASPDGTPFVIDASGRVGIGLTAPGVAVQVQNNTQAALYLDTGPNNSQVSFRRYNTSISSPSVVASGNDLGLIDFSGYDGAAQIVAARITASVDGTPGTNDMPGRLVFSTTADGASSPTERMRIDSTGAVGIGTALTQVNLYNTRNISGNATSYGNYTQATVQSDVGTAAMGYRVALSTQDTAFTLGAIYSFYASQGTITGGSRTPVTNQYGFVADSTLTGATNNYGFYSNIASGTNRYNLYCAGTADNYMAGKLNLGTNGYAGTSFANGRNVTGSTVASSMTLEGFVQSDVTSLAIGSNVTAQTAAASFTLSSYRLHQAQQGIFGAGSSITSQFGFFADSTLTGATNNYGLYSAIAAGTNRYNFYAAGTAANYFAGVTGIGVAAASTSNLTVAASTTAVSSLNIPHGAAPTSPVNGDMWTTTAGLFIRINGVTKTVTLT